MAKYQIKTPEGYEVEVSANNEQEAIQIAKEKYKVLPRIIAKGDDNLRVFQTNNGRRYAVSSTYSTSDEEKIDEILKGKSVRQMEQSAMNQALIESNETLARTQEFLRGAPFVGSRFDELAGAVVGDDAQARSRMLTSAMQAERPVETLGLNVAGGLTMGVPLASLAAPVATLEKGTRIARAGKGALAGTGLGGLEGFVYGTGEGVDGNRLEKGLEGAGTGAMFGGVLGAASPYARDAFENITNAFKRSDIGTISNSLGISANAAKVIKNVFDSGGDLQAAYIAVMRAGENGMLADAGPAAQALLDAVAQSGGTASRTVKEAIDTRMTKTREGLESSLDQTLGQPFEGRRSAIEAIGSRYKDQAKVMYDSAYSKPIDYSTGAFGDQILTLLRRIAKADPDAFKDAVRSANVQAAGDETLAGYRQINAIVDDQGNVSFGEDLPNVLQLDMLKRGLQATAYKTADDFGRLSADGQVYAKLAGQLRDLISSGVPDYGRAVRIGGSKIADEQAFNMGLNMLRSNMDVDEVAFQLGADPSVTQIESAKAGMRTYLGKVMGDVRAIASDPSVEAMEARQVMKAVADLSSDNARKKVRTLLGDQGDELLRMIDQAAQSSQVKAAMARNSATAARLAQKESIEEIAAPTASQQLQSGELVGTTKELIKIATGSTGEYTASQRQMLYNDIARALTEKKGSEALVALKAMENAMKKQNLSNEEVSALASIVNSALYGVSPALTKGAQAEEQFAPMMIDVTKPIGAQ